MMRSCSRLQAAARASARCTSLGCAVYALGFLLWGSISNPTIVSLLTVLEGVAFSMLFTTSVVVVGRLLPSHPVLDRELGRRRWSGSGSARSSAPVVGGFVYETSGR